MTWGLACLAKETLGFSGALKFEFRKVFGGGGRFLVEEQARVSHVCLVFPTELEEGRGVTWRVRVFFFFNLEFLS